MNHYKNWKRLLCLLLTLAAVVGLFAGCGGNTDEPETTGSAVVSGENKTYMVSLKTTGGLVLSDVDVYIYSDESLTDLVSFDKTDSDGIVSFTLPEQEGYAIALSGLPKGYDVQSSYSFTGTNAVITVSTSLVTTGDLTSAGLGLGDVMYDFTITDIHGNTVTLSEVLAQKKAVVLNFWYVGCSACDDEFPVMAEVYEQYADEVEIIAVDPLKDVSSVTTYADSLALPFTVASVPYAWTSIFSSFSGAYPTTVVIDRYGVVCLFEVGATTSKGAWINLFDYFTADDYQTQLVEEFSDLVVKTKPYYTMAEEAEVAAALGSSELNAQYYASTDEYSWPFLIGEKDGQSCLYASNQEIDSSYAILCIDVELKAGQAVGLDYWASTELNTDILHIIVDDEDIYRISGENESWSSVYPCVAVEDGTYSIVISYIKDSDTDDGDDTVYIRNLRVIDAEDIDNPTYLPKEAATTDDGMDYSYVDIYLSDVDGYYHVGSVDGPLLLANLTYGTSQFSEVDSIYMLIYENGSLMIDGEDCFELFQNYASYSTNATISGYCPVTEELRTYLIAAARDEGFDSEDENEWMRLCKYYMAYGTGGEQLEDPIKGLCTESAYTATLGTGVETNYFYYDRMIYPRGLRAAFTAPKAGAYRFTSVSDSVQGVDGWIFDAEGNVLTEYEGDERMYEGDEVSMLLYLDEGETCYLSIAYWDMYEEGYIYYDIEYEGATFDLFRLASPAYFTYYTDETETLYYTIAGGIDVVLGDDGIWYHDLGLDADGNQKYGSKLYADFSRSTGLFSASVLSGSDDSETGMGIVALINSGGFDFTRTESDEYVLAILRSNGNDVDATYAYLLEQWGDDYETYAEMYLVDDVLSGKYHGDGEDYTEAMRQFVSQMDTSGTERDGCVIATKELTDILQMLMDKYTFKDVENSWTKLCYYYDYLRPEN